MGLLDLLRRLLGDPTQPAVAGGAGSAELMEWIDHQVRAHAPPPEIPPAELADACLTHQKVLQINEAMSAAGLLMLFGRVVPKKQAAAVRARFAPRLQKIVDAWHQRLVVPLLAELTPWLEEQLVALRVPMELTPDGATAILDATETSSREVVEALRPLLDAAHQLEQSGSIMLFGRVVPEPVREELRAQFAPKVRQMVLSWQDALQAAHGPAGHSLVAELAAEKFISWVPGKQRGARARLSLAPEVKLDSPAQWVEHGLDTGQLALEHEADRVIAARIRAVDQDDEPNRILEALLATIGRGHLRRLTLGMWSELGEVSYQEALELLAATDSLDALEVLFIGDFQFPEENEISWTTVGDVGPLLERLPALRELRLRGGGVGLGDLRHPRLERLVVETGGLPRAAVGAIAGGHLPALRTLVVWFGDEDYGAEANIDLLRPLLAHDGYPAICRLGLMNADFSDAIAEALGQAIFLDQLEELDLSLGTLGDSGANALAALAPRMPRLRVLRVGNNFLGEVGIRVLREAFGARVEIGEQKTPDDDDDEERRYVSVGE